MTRVAGVILAAGKASRMGQDKRLLPVDGVPMVVRAIRAAQEAGLAPVVVVTGPEPLAGLPPGVATVANPDPGRGMASSLGLGVEALPPEAEAVVVLLADMPRVGAAHVAALVAAFDPGRGREIVVPVCDGRRGNPVLLGRRLFAAMAGLTGDKGARGLIGQHAALVAEVAMDGAVLMDVDTPDDLKAAEDGR